jgi:trehalose 6-phosphate synthase
MPKRIYKPAAGRVSNPRELLEALIVNPYDAAMMSEAMLQGLTMARQEQCSRMRRMREIVAGNNVRRWAGSVPLDAARLHKRDDLDRAIGEAPPPLPANVVPLADHRRMAAP